MLNANKQLMEFDYKLLKLGNPALLQRSTEVTEQELGSSQLQQLLETMWQYMHKEGGIGLAAPQINVFKRVLVYGVEHDECYGTDATIPFTALINPTWRPIGEEMEENWEGCLSVPGLRGLVPRYKQISFSGIDPAGNEISGEVDGLYARLIQHEVDHLDGVLFVQRIKDMRYFGFETEDLKFIKI